METLKDEIPGSAASVANVDMKLEVVIIAVSDVDRAKAFYEKLGWRVDIDVAPTADFRGVQITPHNSDASIIFGKGVTSATPGAASSLLLAVDDIDVARDDLVARGVKVSDVFHYAGGPMNNTGEKPRLSGRDPQGRSYFSFASFEDPDGNSWLLQEITARLPGREWKTTGAAAMNVATLADLLHETAEHHGNYERTHAEHNWWDWYAAYLSDRQKGNSAEQAAAAANHYMDEVFHVPTR
ncbi:MAG TPA: VOC family protein [Pyrinomonadaceae bacterium]|jgi:catechol 2,3-dioxygenase-like lactoylglutathione lyase family enzyme|nr:VOC family protein [Pyrinomonadaceae bacterium]